LAGNPNRPLLRRWSLTLYNANIIASPSLPAKTESEINLLGIPMGVKGFQMSTRSDCPIAAKQREGDIDFVQRCNVFLAFFPIFFIQLWGYRNANLL
jgi:hypothetical protein